MQVKKEIVLVGAGAFGREALSWLRDISPALKIAGFINDDRKTANGLPWLGTIDDYEIRSSQRLLVTISDPKSREHVVSRLRGRGANFASLVHPTAVVASSAALGEGCILCPYSVVSVDATLESFVIVNLHSSVGHDVQIGRCSTLSSHVDLTGRVQLGNRVSVGSSACVLPGVLVGDDATIGAGAVLVRSVPAGTTVYAQPAKRLR